MKKAFLLQIILTMLLAGLNGRDVLAAKIAPDTTLHWRMQVGAGIPIYRINSFSSADDRSYVPLYLRVETDITHWFSAGLAMGYAQRESTTTTPGYLPDGKIRTSIFESTVNAFFGGLRMNFMYKYKKIECYAGFTGGFKQMTKQQVRKDFVDGNQVSESNFDEVVGNPYYLAGTIGLAYYPVKNMGLFVEVGRDFSAPAKAGLSFRFGK